MNEDVGSATSAPSIVAVGTLPVINDDSVNVNVKSGSTVAVVVLSRKVVLEVRPSVDVEVRVVVVDVGPVIGVAGGGVGGVRVSGGKVVRVVVVCVTPGEVSKMVEKPGGTVSVNCRPTRANLTGTGLSVSSFPRSVKLGVSWRLAISSAVARHVWQ